MDTELARELGGVAVELRELKRTLGNMSQKIDDMPKTMAGFVDHHERHCTCVADDVPRRVTALEVKAAISNTRLAGLVAAVSFVVSLCLLLGKAALGWAIK